MKLIPILSFAALITGCASTTMKKVEPSFDLKSINGKNIIVENNALVDFGGFLDLDAAYASGVFKEAYPTDTIYSNDFVKKFADSFSKSTGAKIIMVCGKFDSASCRDKGFDYRLALETLHFHNRLEARAEYFLYNKENKKLLEIDIDNADKISLGGSGRFKEAFVNIAVEDSVNIGKDWKTLQ
jgi:hypothetical protein